MLLLIKSVGVSFHKDSPLVTPSPAPSLHLSDLEAPTQSSTPFATKHVDVSALSGIEALSSTPATQQQQLAEAPPQTTEQIGKSPFHYRYMTISI